MPSRPLEIARVVGACSLSGVAEARFGFASGERRRTAFARQARRACEELGPSFVKLGQLASVRPDVFSAELVFELEKLQDSVPPLPAERVREVVRAEFGVAPEALFADFEDTPIASASIAQVHRARLREAYLPVWGDTLAAGAAVAVKVVRPGAEADIRADLRSARSLVRGLRRVGRPRRVNLEGLLAELGATLESELDLRNEGRVADRFAFDFRDDDSVVVPRVVWPLTTRRVLTAEYLEGWRLSELDAAALAGVDGHALAVHGATAFMRQVLVHGRFHADLHPANIFVTPDSRIAYLDFGIVGRLDAHERYCIAQVLVALVYGDADRALRYSAELGVEVPPEKRAAVRAELTALLGATLAGERADVRHFGIGFLSMLGRHGIDIPVGYGLLVKSLVTVEGVARALYPDIDIIETAKPFATGIIGRAALSPERLYERLPAAMRAAMRELVG